MCCASKVTTTQAIERVGNLLERKEQLEEQVGAMKASAARATRENEALQDAMRKFPGRLTRNQRENDAKIAELVNHLDILIGVCAIHAKTMIRSGGGFAPLAAVFEKGNQHIMHRARICFD